MSWTDQVEAVNPPVYEDRADYPPRIWWYNGVKQARTPGVFFTKLDEHPGPLPAPWTNSNRYDEAAYETPQLRVALIGQRQTPFTNETDAAGQRRRHYVPKWQPGAQIYNEWLCFVEGLDYPCVLCSKGLTGKALAGVLKAYRAGVLKPAERIARRNLPLWSFWMPIAGMTDKGKPVYADTGFGSFVTPPELKLPDLAEAKLTEALFVGPDLLVLGVDVRNEYDAWLKEKRVDVEGETAANGAPALDELPPPELTEGYDEIPWSQ